MLFIVMEWVDGDSLAKVRKLVTKRGHRLTFSNGIIVLAIVAITLLLVTRANVTALVAVYAIGVFTGFTMAGAGMSKHHWVHRARGWRHKFVINGSASVLSAIVVLILAVAKFKQGAWTVVLLFPILTIALIRLNRQYRAEAQQLDRSAHPASPHRSGLRGPPRPGDCPRYPVRPQPQP